MYIRPCYCAISHNEKFSSFLFPLLSRVIAKRTSSNSQFTTQKEQKNMPMKIGLLVPQGWRMDLVGIPDPVEAYETMTRVAQEADALGYDSIWLYDHFHTVPTPTQEVTFECWTSTAALA